MERSIKLITPQAGDFPRLLEIWESSVRATHDFLTEDNIRDLRALIIEHNMFANTTLTCAQTADNIIIGFIGVTGESLDTLFVDGAYRGRGVGNMLILKAIKVDGVKKVDVNEQNPGAIRFYERYGFTTVSRSETDGLGNPYPLLHMELIQ